MKFFITLGQWLRGIITTLLIILNAIIVPLCLVVTALVCYFFFFIPPLQRWLYAHTVYPIPYLWSLGNNLIMNLMRLSRWKIEIPDNLSMDNWYLLIANHRTWMDILVLSYVFNSKVCGMRFFMKKELIWQLGLAGMSCWILRYPFLARHTKEQIRKNPKLKGKDIESARIACNRLKKLPCTLISFAEGTRFTRRKHARQKSPFVHLLKPKAGGVAVVIQEMHNELSGIIDVTIKYRTKKMSFWNFACGRVKKITVLAELRPLTKDLIGNYYHDREFRKHFQAWLNEVWEKKDRLYQDIR